VGFDSAPGPGSDLPAAGISVKDEGDLAFFPDRFAVFLAGVDRADDRVSILISDCRATFAMEESIEMRALVALRS
jgi:predicted RNA-binding protein with TRAM domain